MVESVLIWLMLSILKQAKGVGSCDLVKTLFIDEEIGAQSCE